jgi:hypothetical protein
MHGPRLWEEAAAISNVMLGSSVVVFGWYRIVRRHVIAGLANSFWRIGQAFPRINRNRSAASHGP